MESLERVLRHGKMENRFTVAERTVLADRKNQRYAELLQKLTPNDILPGIRDLLDECRRNGIRTALASASKNAPFILEKLKLTEHFDYVADPAGVEHSKPAPDVFLNAAASVGVKTECCVGIEGAEAGIEAVHAAGMLAVGVGSEEHLRKADLLFGDTKEISFRRIQEF